MADKLFTTYWTELAAAALAHADAVGIEDTGALFTATNVEAALAEVKALADSATQPGDLGTAATTDATAYATAAQGALADSAQQVAEKGAVDGYASLDSSGVVPLGQIPDGIARDSEVTAAVSAAIDALLAGAPGALDTLNELAAAIGDDADFAGTVTTALAGKQPLNANLTSIAALTTTSFGRSLLAEVSAATLRSAIGLVVGTDVQAFSAVLAATTAAFTTADESKLDGIEALADVTDTANVTAAGALMDSEVTNLAAVKAFDPATYVAKTAFPDSVSIALSDMTTQITTGTIKAYWVNPFDAVLTITKVKATLVTAGSGATVVDINEGAGAGTSILSTKITIDASGTDSDAAGTPPVVSDVSIAADGRLTFDIDTAGTSAAGLMVHIMFTRPV